VQAGELLDIDRLSRRLRPLLDLKRSDAGESLADEFELDRILDKARGWRAEFGDNIRDTVEILRQAIDDDARILLEGQLGVMRDLDWGTYPYVTSSTTFAAGAGSGAGVPPREIRNIVAVVKAYTTAVGAGPLPTEMHGPDATNLRERGHEYGATTGRPRRVGWLDGVALRYAAEVGAFSSLAITKLDVLDGMDPVKIAVAYTVDGHAVERFPHPSRLDDARPVYEDLPGWTTPTGNARKLDDLPDNARQYVRRIEEIAGVPVSLIGVGETRDAIIELEGERPMLAVS
jgi:adenylosuccinate synthase